MRNYLVYVSAKGGKCLAELFGADRLFDVAVNDWSRRGAAAAESKNTSSPPTRRSYMVPQY